MIDAIMRPRRAPLLLLALAGCASPFAPFEPAMPWTPPDWYEVEYHLMERCTGLSYPYTWVQWYLADDTHAWGPHGERWAAYWREPNIIVVGRQWMDYRSMVRHEVLHLLSQDVGHDGWWWGCYYWEIEEPTESEG